ncbi:MAG TPA: hypothetical protein VMH39_03700 [Gemmatimonadaceae bacterium]|nr:hypothetical protein [Gemmatimonadaceae bacterium]
MPSITPRERAKYEQLLLNERRTIEALLESAKEDLGDGEPSDVHHWPATDPSDIAAETTAREAGSILAAHESNELADIDEALRLLYTDPDRYGVCAFCGSRIESSRLDILPATKMCARHAA